jgi:archaellin
MPDNNSNPQTDGKKDSITISKKEAVLIAVIMSLIVCAAVISLIALSIKVNHSPQGSTTVQNGTYYSTSAISTTSGSMNSSSDETSPVFRF